MHFHLFSVLRLHAPSWPGREVAFAMLVWPRTVAIASAKTVGQLVSSHWSLQGPMYDGRVIPVVANLLKLTLSVWASRMNLEKSHCVRCLPYARWLCSNSSLDMGCLGVLNQYTCSQSRICMGFLVEIKLKSSLWGATWTSAICGWFVYSKIN